MVNKHKGSNFNDFLEEEGLLGEVEAIAVKRVIAYQISQTMKKKDINKTDMASKMHTNRASLDRVLDPENAAVTLKTLVKAAHALGKKLNVSLG